MLSPAPSALTGTTLMALLTSLPLPSSAADEIVALHAPFVQPSHLPQSQLGKWLARLNNVVTAREPAAASLAATLVDQDTEGYAAAQYGKGWMGACLGMLAAPTTSPESLPAFLKLARSLIAAAPHAPAFEREVVQPAMGKIAVSMARLVERLVEGRSWTAVYEAIDATRALLIASPPPFRPAAPALRVPLNAIILGTVDAPENVRFAAAQTLAVVHMAAGKASAPTGWGSDMRDALGGLAASLSAMTVDAWEEEPPRANPPPPPASLPAFPVDPADRVAATLAAVEGYTETALAMLCATSARPVPIPLAQIVSAALRCLNLTFDTPVAAHVSPHHHAVLVASLPKVWTTGLLLLASAMAACGDHLVPHLTGILEHTVYLLERVPSNMADVRLKLFQFHSIMLNMYPAGVLPVEYTTRLLKFSLGVMGGLLDARPPTSAPAAQGRKNKKRARGQEDALIGGLEGRAPRATSAVEAEIVRAALSLSPKIHSAALLPPALLTFSIRLHLSLYVALSTRPSFFVDLASGVAVREALEHALEHAATLECGGTARDVRTLLIAFLPSTIDRNAHFDLLLHPALPPLARPLPPLSQLHMFAPESQEERRVRREMGFKNPEDEDDEEEDGDEDEEDDAMAVDEWAASAMRNGAPAQVSVPVPAPAPAAVAVPVPHRPVHPPPAIVASAPAPFTAPVAAAAAPAPAAAPVQEEPIDVTVTQASAVSFMSGSTSTASAQLTVPAPAQTAPTPAAAAAAPADDGDDSDEEIPDLDSGSSDEEE